MHKTEVVNRHGVIVKKDDYWFMDIDWKPWLMKINHIQSNGLVEVKHVNWKRKGKGLNWSRMSDEFGWSPALRKCTEEEIKYFNERWGK